MLGKVYLWTLVKIRGEFEGMSNVKALLSFVTFVCVLGLLSTDLHKVCPFGGNSSLSFDKHV